MKNEKKLDDTIRKILKMVKGEMLKGDICVFQNFPNRVLEIVFRKKWTFSKNCHFLFFRYISSPIAESFNAQLLLYHKMAPLIFGRFWLGFGRKLTFFAKVFMWRNVPLVPVFRSGGFILPAVKKLEHCSIKYTVKKILTKNRSEDEVRVLFREKIRF